MGQTQFLQSLVGVVVRVVEQFLHELSRLGIELTDPHRFPLFVRRGAVEDLGVHDAFRLFTVRQIDQVLRGHRADVAAQFAGPSDVVPGETIKFSSLIRGRKRWHESIVFVK